MVALIAGLPESSRYWMRRSGETDPYRWSSTDWLLLDIRNIAEALRVMMASQGAKRGAKRMKMRDWDYHPGAKQQKQKKIDDMFARLHSLADAGGQLKNTL